MTLVQLPKCHRGIQRLIMALALLGTLATFIAKDIHRRECT